ncbi:MAG: hypothetical protein QW228_08600 [Candidatus Aenigmatarchaeota archaeon]
MVRVRVVEIEKVLETQEDAVLRISYQVLDNNYVSPIAFFTISQNEAKKGGIEKKLEEIIREYKKHKFVEREVR